MRIVWKLRRIYVLDVLWRTGEEFARKGGFTYAAALAYFALLSLFPFLIFLIAVFGLFLRDPDLSAEVIEVVLTQVPQIAGLREELEAAVSGIAHEQPGLFGLLFLAGTIWAASGLFAALREALNVSFDVPERRSFVHGKLVDIVGVLTGGVLVFLSLVASAVLSLMRALAADLRLGDFPYLLWQLGQFALPFLISFTAILLLYRLIPDRWMRFSELWIGALVAALGFELTKLAFGLFLAYSPWYEQVYGALAGVVLFLVFIFTASHIILFGAELASQLCRDRVDSQT